MKLLQYFFSAYPKRSILTCIAITFAGTIGGLSISALIPLFGKIISGDNVKSTFVDEAFRIIGINPSLETLAAIVVGGIILKSIILAVAKIYAGFTVAKVIKDLRIKLINSLSQAEWKYFTSQPAGKLASSLMSESTRAGKGYLTSLEILSALTQIIVYLTLSFFISWQIVLLAVLTSILLWFLLNTFIKKNRSLGEQTTHLSRNITSQLIDSTRSIKSLKAMGRETHSNALIESFTKKLKIVSKKLTVSTQLLAAFQEIFLTLAIFFGIYTAIEFLDTSIESIIVLSIFYTKSISLVGKAQKKYQLFATNQSGFEGIIESINTATLNYENKQGIIKHAFSGNIKIENISFSHGNSNILENASAVIQHNKINTIIGSSGVGKTTFVDLLCGLHTHQSGKILIDDIPISDINILFWRSQIGYVVQDNTLLNASIKDNITLGDPTFTDDQVNTALKKAHAYEFTYNLPDGTNSIVGEGGTKLSGGQRQRILIARALVHSPKLLVLDEATSALDDKTEKSLSKIFKELSKEVTIISISHRAALIDISDQIIELKNNKLIQLNT